MKFIPKSMFFLFILTQICSAQNFDSTFFSSRKIPIPVSTIGNNKSNPSETSLIQMIEDKNRYNPIKSFPGFENLGTYISNPKSNILNKDKLPEGFLLSEDTYQYWTDSSWINSHRALYSYDFNNNIASMLVQMWNISVWENYTRTLYTYDLSNNLKEELRQYWSDSLWVNTYKYTYEYDNFNNLLTTLEQDWRDSVWVNYYMLTYSYDNNNLIQLLFQSWQSSKWVNGIRRLYTYDNNGNKIEELHQQWEDDSVWVNQDRRLYEYDLNNYLTVSTLQDYYSQWVNAFRGLYYYDESYKLIEEDGQEWVWGLYWDNSDRVVFNYDTNNYVAELVNQDWSDSTWINAGREDYGYDINYNILSILNQLWLNSNWVNSERELMSYILTDIENSVNQLNNYKLSQNYPNPFNPSTTINYQVQQSGFVTLKVYDILGKEVATLVNKHKNQGKYSVKFDASGLASGVYIYRLHVNDYVSTKKMLLLK